MCAPYAHRGSVTVHDMARVVARERKDGGVSYYVRWVAGGSRGGKNESEIFADDEDAAERFKNLVDGHGQQWPPGWIRGRGFISDLRSPDEMFEPFAMKYIDLLTGIQGDTRRKYRRLVEQNMSPWFKSHSIRDGEGGITREMVQMWVDDLSKGELAPHDPKDRKARTKYVPKTIMNQHGLLHGIFQAAVDSEPPLRATNPCDFTSLPRGDADEIDEEMVFLEREEFAWLLECIADDAQELLEGFGETGGRWGEVTALQPRDLRRRNGRPAIRIQRAWKRDEDGKPYLGAPKTKKSRRTIVVTEQYWQKLKRRAQGKAPDDLLFTGPEGGRWDAGTFRRLRFQPAIKLAAEKFGLIKRPRVHDIRHSHASWLIAAKVPLPAIQGRLGHESITTTVDRYGHLLDALDDEVMAAVAWAMDPSAPLPGFLQYSGRADAPLLAVPAQQQNVVKAEPHDDQEQSWEPDVVFVVQCGPYELAFSNAEHARDAADQWNDDRQDRDDPATVEERAEWTGDGAIWSRLPNRQFVWKAKASYGPNGSLMYEPEAVSGRWIWEFEVRDFTTRRVETQINRETKAGGIVLVQARGINKKAVSMAFEEAHGELTKDPLLSPDGRGAGVAS